MDQKTVFISYRRDRSKHLARAIYQDLKMSGWDVFLDVNTIDSGDFDRIILNQIGARAHFILLISPGSLERCASPGDWVLREIEEAVRLGRNIVPIIEKDADFIHEMNYLPEALRGAVSTKSGLPLSHFFFDAAMEMLRTRFLKTPEYVPVQEVSAADRVEVQRRIAAADVETPGQVPRKPSSIDLMPGPFGWIEIPGGHGMLKTNESGVSLSIPTDRYYIAKYPVTNAQFAKFIKADGYRERKWWTDAGWKQREKSGWTEPRYWNDRKWNGADQPVVGVSWFEAVAFCLWLSDVTGEKIMLPTDDQWQYAAQGDDGRTYPWGNDWDCKRCNNSLKPCDSKVTTPVTQYEGKNKGDSHFSAVDMAGNAWEWCLTDSANKLNDMDGDAEYRLLRGGSCFSDYPYSFRCEFRYWDSPFDRNDLRGFRLVRS